VHIAPTRHHSGKTIETALSAPFPSLLLPGHYQETHEGHWQTQHHLKMKSQPPVAVTPCQQQQQQQQQRWQ
jgi:hypothetical protein